MHLYYITDRSAFPGNEAARRRQLLEKISEAARAGVEYIQLREKDLAAGDLESLTRKSLRILRDTRAKTKLLLNSRTDVALAVEANGVHLRGDDIHPYEVRTILFAMATRNSRLATRGFLTAVSCHSVEDVRRAELDGANFAVLAPIFGKQTTQPVQDIGLESLKVASQGKMPVFSLGGLTLENARACRDAGAAGIAGIRLFQDNDIQKVARKLHSL